MWAQHNLLLSAFATDSVKSKIAKYFSRCRPCPSSDWMSSCFSEMCTTHYLLTRRNCILFCIYLYWNRLLYVYYMLYQFTNIFSGEEDEKDVVAWIVRWGKSNPQKGQNYLRHRQQIFEPTRQFTRRNCTKNWKPTYSLYMDVGKIVSQGKSGVAHHRLSGRDGMFFFACQTYHSHHSSPGVQQNLGNWCLRDTQLVVVPPIDNPNLWEAKGKG